MAHINIAQQVFPGLCGAAQLEGPLHWAFPSQPFPPLPTLAPCATTSLLQQQKNPCSAHLDIEQAWLGGQIKLQSIESVDMAVKLCISADCTSPRLICERTIDGWLYAWYTYTTQVCLALLTAHSLDALHAGLTQHPL